MINPAEFACTRYEIGEHVATVTLNRPERRNALNPRAYAEIEAAFRAVSGDETCVARSSPAPIPPSAPAKT